MKQEDRDVTPEPCAHCKDTKCESCDWSIGTSGPVVLLSGGVDSALMVAIATNPRPLYVCYGQPARREEYTAAKELCDAFDVRLGTGYSEMRLAKMAAPARAPGPRIVPGRNGILLWSAVNFAKSIGSKEIHIGCTRDDVEYADCSEQFIASISASTEISDGIKVTAPLIGHSKSEIVEWARAVDVPLELTWSCYSPVGAHPCGACNACNARREAGA